MLNYEQQPKGKTMTKQTIVMPLGNRGYRLEISQSKAVLEEKLFTNKITSKYHCLMVVTISLILGTGMLLMPTMREYQKIV